MPKRSFSAALVAGLLTVCAAPRADALDDGSGFRVPDGFRVRLMYEVPGDTEGSWVALAGAPDGSLVASDQYGVMYRVDVGDAGVDVRPIEYPDGVQPLAGAQGLLFAHDALYVSVNNPAMGSGVYRMTDGDGDGRFNAPEKLIAVRGGGEHGPHALISSPDGRRIYWVAGNNTTLPRYDRSRVPEVWDEDQTTTRLPDGGGHNTNRLAPGGFVASFKPDGSDVELIATGFRNPYDLAFDDDGELFTYDADMEWDIGLPWYRPTRINHVIDGAEFGWRNGSGKWPAEYPDSFGSVVDIGPGSPTGITFGRGAKMPARYQRALFIGDWSYGNIHAVWMTSDGGTYDGTFETFATAAPLAVTDMVVRPGDGHLYFAVGGRKTASGLYRIEYVGDESTDPPVDTVRQRPTLDLRRRIERDDVPVQRLVRMLDHPDRSIRFAARVAIERRGSDAARGALRQAVTDAEVTRAAIAVCRTGGVDDADLVLRRLRSIDAGSLTDADRVPYLRASALASIRLRPFDDDRRSEIAGVVGPWLGSASAPVRREASRLLARLGRPDAVGLILDALEAEGATADQIHHIVQLNHLSDTTAGWTDDDRRRQWEWFAAFDEASGGHSMTGYLAGLRDDALAALSDEQRESLATLIEPPSVDRAAAAEKTFVRQWTVEDLNAEMDAAADPDAGAVVYDSAGCVRCHRFDGRGGHLGPDLTSVRGKFSVRDLLRSIVDPDHEVSDQYASTQFVTVDGDILVGRVVNMNEDHLRLMTDMNRPGELTRIATEDIVATKPSTTSPMPSGLLDYYTADQVASLVAYLRRP